MSLSNFVSSVQASAISAGLRGEEREFFLTATKEIQTTINTMPVVYDQDGKGDDAIAYLHYFVGGCDFYITEKDTNQEQHQAYGLVSLGYEPEVGYISLPEILLNGAELDLHFTPKTLGEIKKEKGWT